MTVAVPPDEASQRLADNLARRSALFKLTLGTGVGLFLYGLFSEVVFHATNTWTIKLFGNTFKVFFSAVCWGAAVYPFLLAARAIWLPDDKLRTASRNLRLMAAGIGVIVVITLIVWTVQGRF